MMAEPRTPIALLVVDDDAAQRSLLKSFLVQQGFMVTTAASGEEALDQVTRNRPQLVISDVRMPGLSGLELLGHIRASIPDLPMLLVTAYADVRDAVGAMRDGAVNYLEKPIDFDELLASRAPGRRRRRPRRPRRTNAQGASRRHCRPEPRHVRGLQERCPRGPVR